MFSDIEGSTKLLLDSGSAPYAEALLEHRRVLREAFTRHGGVEVGTEGDSFFVAFPTATGAVEAARDGQAALALLSIRVRMGLHTGIAHLADDDYVGADVHLAARVAAAAHGGQVLLSSATAALVDPDGLRDLGEHRLKDFPQPVPISQVGTERFPPLRTVSNTNLPRPASAFVGREREVSEIATHLRDGTRLLTLTGPGGSGKSRLAVEAATDLVGGFRAGVFWVGLAAIRDPGLVTAEIATTLGAKSELAAHIADREMLLVIDNLEQVIEAGSQIASLVEACPHLRVLCTSREVLRVRGEVEYAVSPLADREAVELFCVRADMAPDDTIGRLCRALDNLPLAVELAAARARVLSPGQILSRLSTRLDLLKGGRDAEPRQQTLRATIEWSHDLLSEEERRLFARLSVFRGGCTLEAAEEVVDADLDTLAALLDKSLLRQTGDRFWMLETIRAHAAERLEASSEGLVWKRRHAEHFMAVAEEAYPHLTGSPKEWYDLLTAEHDNFRVALDRLGEGGHTQEALELAGALWKFWSPRGHVPEGRARIEAALADDHTPTAARARALNGATAFALRSDDLATAEARAREALQIHRDLGDEAGISYSQYLLGTVIANRGDHERARAIYHESVETFRAMGDDHYTLLALRALAWMHEELGDIEGYRALRREHLELATAVGNQRMIALGKRFMAGLATDDGRFQEALSLAREAFEAHRSLGDQVELASDLRQIAETLIEVGHPGSATRVLATAEAICEQIGGTFESWVVVWTEEMLTTLRAQLEDPDFAAAWEHGQGLMAEEAFALAERTLST